MFVVCIHVDIYTRGRKALWHCLQGKCTRAPCHSLEGKGEGRSDLSIQYMYTSIYCEYVLRGTQEQCLAMLVTHAKASGLIALHRVHSKLLYSLGALLFAVCRFVDIYTRRGKALWHCVQGKCTWAFCHCLEGKEEGHSDWSMHYR